MTNICRCGTYQRIRAAVRLAADNVLKREVGMNETIQTAGAQPSRRDFVVGSAVAAGSGLALGFHLPGIGAAAAQGAARAPRSTPGWWSNPTTPA